MHIIDAFDSNVRKYGDSIFLHFDGRDISYAEVADASRRAAALFRDLGIVAGDRIGVMCFNTPGFVYAMLGAWRLGAVLVPINHKMQAPEVDFVLGHASVRVLVFDGALSSVVEQLKTPVLALSTERQDRSDADFDAAIRGIKGIEGAPPDENAVAEILYTSGTTGRPKGCVHTHRNILLTAMNIALALSITREERVLLTVPIWHASPLNNWLLGTLYVGGAIVLLREYEPHSFLNAVEEKRVTLCFGPPVIYTAPLAAVADFAERDLSSVRAWIYGGGPIGSDVARRLMVSYRSDRFFQVYGMTESGPLGTALYPSEQLAKAGSIGRGAMPGAELRLVLGNGREAAAGQIGEIWMRSDTMMLGYLDDPAATTEAFAHGGWYRTGDLARRDDDGYMFIVDRRTDMIITGGENVYSKEVEDAITAHPSVAEAAVVGRLHPEWGETVVACIVPANEATTVNPDDLRRHLRQRLAKYKIPREIRVVDRLPRTPSGKVRKDLLREAISVVPANSESGKR